MPIADPTLGRLTSWAEGNQETRAVILTSSRAIPEAPVDAYSDYDLIMVVERPRSMLADLRWLTEFGEILIAYWDPVESGASGRGESVRGIIHYVNGLKIDVDLWSLDWYAATVARATPLRQLDAGYEVILDKDHLTSILPAPSRSSYVPARPDEDSYQRLVAGFLIGVPYVAKSLLRGQLLPARWVLDFDMRFTYLVPMLEWRVECDHDWNLRTGRFGTGLETHLSEEVRSDLRRTFSDADLESNWRALFASIALFRRVAREVAVALDYSFPDLLFSSVADHAHRMREGVFAAGPLIG